MDTTQVSPHQKATQSRGHSVTLHRRLPDAVLVGLASIGLALSSGGFSCFASAQDAPASANANAQKGIQAKKPDYSPYPDQHFPDRVYWGVAHVHTGYSFDAGLFGITLTYDDLFRVASGGRWSSTTASATSRTGRWTGFPLPTMPSIWASPIRFRPAVPLSSRTRRASAGTICPRKARRRVSKPPSKRSSPSGPASRSSTAPRSCATLGRTPPPRANGSRAGRVHHAARLRVDVRAQCQQPASHRHLPRQRRPREPGPAVLGV